MPRTKRNSYPERRRRKAARQSRMAAMREDLLALRLADARVKSAAIQRVEKDRRRDEYLDEIYCGRWRAMVEEVAYQERAGQLSQEWWERGHACSYKVENVKPQHAALLAHHNLHPPESKLTFEEQLRLRHKALAERGIFRGEYAKHARLLEETTAPEGAPLSIDIAPNSR